MIKNYGSFILEKFGSNELANKLSKFLIDKINYNFGKLLLNKKIIINIDDFDHINFINSKIYCELSNSNYGAIKPNLLKIESNKIEEFEMILNIKLSDIEKKSKKLDINNKIISTIEHEFLHLIELYYSKINDNNLSKSWKMGKELQKLNKKYNNKTWNDISYFIYLMFPHEIRARIHQLDSEIKNNNLNNNDEINNFIVKSKIYKDLEFLSKLNYNLLIDKLKTENNYDKIIYDFSTEVLNKTENHEKEFKNYLKNIINKSKRLLKKLIKISYSHFIYEEFDKEIDYEKWIDINGI